MKYTVPTVAKALIAFAVTAVSTAAGLAGGADLSALELGQWMAVIGAGLTAGGGVFYTPNKSAEPEVAPADLVVSSVQAVLEQASAATADLEKVKQAVGSVVGIIPGMGPLAAQVINSIPTTAYSQFTDHSVYQRPYDR